ncbi:MAG: hypothetical protein Q8S13_09450 [Dehalococcoidia bacterium]|nr:hypothetical protein [Dehalococcoidia bacterium]
MITKSMADAWIAAEEHQKQRRVRGGVVDKLVRARQSGAWILTHQGIAFRRSDGDRLDGNHRLQMISRTGIATEMVVAWEVDDAAALVIDTGTSRSNPDIMAMRGEVNANQRHGVVRILSLLMTGTAPPFSPTEVETVINWCRPMFEWSEEVLGSSVGGKGLRTAPIIGACMFARPSDPDKVADFVDKMMRKAVSTSDEMPSLVREKFSAKLMVANSGDGGRLAAACTVLGAIRRYLDGERGESLKVISIASVRQRFMDKWIKAYGSWPLFALNADNVATRSPARRRGVAA